MVQVTSDILRDRSEYFASSSSQNLLGVVETASAEDASNNEVCVLEYLNFQSNFMRLVIFNQISKVRCHIQYKKGVTVCIPLFFFSRPYRGSCDMRISKSAPPSLVLALMESSFWEKSRVPKSQSRSLLDKRWLRNNSILLCLK